MIKRFLFSIYILGNEEVGIKLEPKITDGIDFEKQGRIFFFTKNI